jgi:hypothetical protein
MIPYKVKDRISSVFPFPWQFFRMAQNVLLFADGLGLLVYYLITDKENSPIKPMKLPLPTPQTAYTILRHITMRTLPFQKLFEFVRVKDIINGMPTIGVAGAPMKNSTVKRGLSGLYRSGFLCNLKLPTSRTPTPMYALNLYHLLALLYQCWSNAIMDKTNDEDFNPLSNAALKAYKLNSHLVEYLDNFKSVFNFLLDYEDTIKNVSIFIETLESKIRENVIIGDGDFESAVQLLEDFNEREFLDDINDKLIKAERNSRPKKFEIIPYKYREIFESEIFSALLEKGWRSYEEEMTLARYIQN